MNVKEKIIELAKNNNGIVTTAMIVEAGFSRGIIKYLCDKGVIEKSARGIYIIPKVWDDEMFNLQYRFKKGVYSHETALFLWDLTDRTPSKFHMTFPTTYNLLKPKEVGILCSQCKKEFYDLGITTTKTPSGNSVFVYNAERTLCDILRVHNRIDVQLVSEAFKRYTSRKNKNIPLLSEYAKILKVEEKVRLYLEVLL